MLSYQVWTNIREYAELMVILGVLMVGTMSIATQFEVRGPSMEPTLSPNNRVVVNRLAAVQMGGFSLYGNGHFLFQGPERGDIIIFEPQDQGPDSVVKRVIGIPGDNVDITSSGEVFVNGARENFGNGPTDNQGFFNYPIMVPEGHYFVIGDNRGQSRDSRNWGFLPASDVIGKVWAVVWPFEDIVIE